MKKTVLRIVSIVLLLNSVTFTSCQKDETADGIIFRAKMEDCTSSDGKTALNGTHLYWSPGDKIVVFGSRPGKSGIFETRANHSAGWTEFKKNEEVGTGPFDGPYRAIYPVSSVGDVTHISLPAVQHSEDGILDHYFPMCAQTRTDMLEFKNICGVIRLSLYKPDVYASRPDVRVKAIKILAETEINGHFELSYDGNNPVITYADGGTNEVWFVCDKAQSISSLKSFYIFIPPGRYRNLKILILTDDGRYCEKTLKNNVVLNCYRSQTTDITLWNTDLTFLKATPMGALPGYFSVSPSIQVQFAPGNLDYQMGAGTWQFAESQLDDGEYFDFGSGYYPGQGRSYYGYNEYCPYGFHNELPPFVDWGMNAIDNGGNEPNAWRTLSIEEWDYLFHSRPNASEKYGIAYVSDGRFSHQGMILLPDDWTLPGGLHFTPGWPTLRDYVTDYYNRFIIQQYNSSQWSEMEANGAVFLMGDWFGEYWSSTAINNSQSYGVEFFFTRTPSEIAPYTIVYVYDANLLVPYALDCFDRASVRLVHDVE